MTDHAHAHAQAAQDLQSLITSLDAAHSTSTMSSLISLALPPAVPLADITNMLADEHRAASRIKSAAHRVPVTSAIALAQAKLGEYTQVPANGVYVYCGTAYGPRDQEQRVVSVAYEPGVPVKQFMYLCDKVFSTDALVEVLEEVADAEVVDQVKADRERSVLAKMFDEESTGSGKCCFGIQDTLKALDLGAVETLLVWDYLNVQRYVLKTPAAVAGGAQLVKYLTPLQEQVGEHFVHDGHALEIVDKMPLLAWFTQNVGHFGAQLKQVSDRSQEGARFVSEHGGIGGLLRYQVDLGH